MHSELKVPLQEFPNRKGGGELHRAALHAPPMAMGICERLTSLLVQHKVAVQMVFWDCLRTILFLDKISHWIRQSRSDKTVYALGRSPIMVHRPIPPTPPATREHAARHATVSPSSIHPSGVQRPKRYHVKEGGTDGDEKVLLSSHWRDLVREGKSPNHTVCAVERNGTFPILNVQSAENQGLRGRR